MAAWEERVRMRKFKLFLIASLVLALGAGVALAYDSPNSAAPALTEDQVVDHFIQREQELVQAMRNLHPMVETYYQAVRPDAELGSVPESDRYFLGRLDFSDGVEERFYNDFGEKLGLKQVLRHGYDPTYGPRQLFKMRTSPIGFTAQVFPDTRGFDRDNYTFQFLRREFLGEVRCFVFQVAPRDKKSVGRFLGRIWVEDRDYNIVRFNGTFTNPPRWKFYFHMDSWRANLQPGLWLPAEVYSEESGVQYGLLGHSLRFKAQTRLWAYDLQHAGRQEEFTQMVIDHPAGNSAIKDESEGALDWSPVLSLRAWQREAEDNVLERLEQAGLLAPVGEVDKILQTVVANLQITNNLDLQPEVHCRVLLTSPLETFTVGHTIIVSRGLLDVLPDEVSLAMVLSHELAHIAAGDQLDTKYAFGDRMWFADEATFQRFNFQRTPQSEANADKRALELLKNSPYKDKLASAGLFLRQLAARAASIPNLTTPQLGDGLTERNTVTRMAELMQAAPALEVRKIDQVAALPLGGRIKLNPWDDHIELKKTKPVQLQSFREKMPFEIAPLIPHLTRLTNNAVASNSSGVN